MIPGHGSRTNPTRAPSLLLFLSLFFLLPGVAASGQTAPEQGRVGNLYDFTYNAQRRDPFERSTALKTRAQAGTQAVKSGYELEELKLVGVLKAGPEKFAVMEDTQGKGLLFKKGENLNKNLWVSDILEEKIVLAYRLRGDTRMISLNIPRK